jgi:hypothetical protein
MFGKEAKMDAEKKQNVKEAEVGVRAPWWLKNRTKSLLNSRY